MHIQINIEPLEIKRSFHIRYKYKLELSVKSQDTPLMNIFFKSHTILNTSMQLCILLCTNPASLCQ